jgi:hypothetical protein
LLQLRTPDLALTVTMAPHKQHGPHEKLGCAQEDWLSLAFWLRTKRLALTRYLAARSG